MAVQIDLPEIPLEELSLINETPTLLSMLHDACLLPEVLTAMRDSVPNRMTAETYNLMFARYEGIMFCYKWMCEQRPVRP